jgi:hypothetical protein
MWRRSWVDGVDRFESRRPVPFRLAHDDGTGLMSQGTADWVDYRVSADVTIVLATNAGIAARVGGMRRWYGLLLCDDGFVRLVKNRDGITVLAEQPLPLEPDRGYHLELSVQGNRIAGVIDRTVQLDAVDEREPLRGGGVAMVVTQGTMTCGPIRVRPLSGVDTR